MDVDRALLEWVSRGSARLVFRTYGWDRPTLSLGRSEPFPDGWDERALARDGIAAVRRPTGGSAVLHAEEVTFALAARVPGPWVLSPRDFANAAAQALSGALRACGISGSRVHGGAARAPARAAGAVCFARGGPGEVEAAGYKVAGLASRFGRAGGRCHAWVPPAARTAFAFAMGLVEAACVVTLKKLYFPEGWAPPFHPIPASGLRLEQWREVATLVMIGAVACLGRPPLRIALARGLWIFGLWDLFYYALLRLWTGFPSSLLD